MPASAAIVGATAAVAGTGYGIYSSSEAASTARTAAARQQEAQQKVLDQQNQNQISAQNQSAQAAQASITSRIKALAATTMQSNPTIATGPQGAGTPATNQRQLLGM